MRKFFTADLHFGHTNLITKMGRKGFASIEEHDQVVLENINSKVDRHDYLFILGDFGNVKKRHQIRCRHVVFIIGNHDKRNECEKTFGQIYVDKVIKFGGTKAVLYHYPTAYWNGSHKGWYHFYGHCHDQREGTLDAVWPQRRALDVGIDSAQKLLGSPQPFSEYELVEILGDQPGHDPVEFYQGVRYEPVRSPLEQFIQTLKNMGIREGSSTRDWCIFDRGSRINVQVGPACFIFNPDGSYREVRE